MNIDLGFLKRSTEAAQPIVDTAPKKRRKRPVHVSNLVEELYRVIEERPHLTVKEYMAHFKVSENTIRNYLAPLEKEGYVRHTNSYPRRYYVATAENGAETITKENELEAQGERNNKILQFISDHDGERYTYRDIAAGTGIPAGSVHYYMKGLIGRGLVPKDWGVGPRVEPPKPAVETPKKEANEATFTDIVETLIWEYVKTTRKTDLLAFLTWLEAKK